MYINSWDNIPGDLKNDDVKFYYDILSNKKFNLFIKRACDILLSVILLIILSPVLLLISIIIKIDSKGPVFFRQERVTTYGKIFRIFKFRTMVVNAESIGTQVTVENDTRITKVGKFLRKVRLDETPQLINILVGDMSFVGTRPEVQKYCKQYTDEMKATLLMPAGVTSLASIMFKDEEKLLQNGDNIDETYVTEVLPKKMQYNLEYIKNFSFTNDIKLLFKTFFAVLK